MKSTPTYKQFVLDIKSCNNSFQRLQVIKEYVDFYKQTNNC